MSKLKRKRSTDSHDSRRLPKPAAIESESESNASFGGFGSDDDAEYGDFEDLEARSSQGSAVEELKGADEERLTSMSGNKPPTRDELRSIKEASELYKSNTFKFAIDALLPNVRPKDSRIKPLEDFLRLLHSSLMSAKPIKPSPPLEAAIELEKKGVSVPYPLPYPTEEVAWKVSFDRPSDIMVVGSWATKSGAKSTSAPRWTVDIAIEIPKELFQEKDYLDNRFFHKRAFYLASLAHIIKSDKSLQVDVAYDSALSDTRMTTLLLTSKPDSPSANFSKLHAGIRLIPTLPEPCPIPLSHLSPLHRNIRLKNSTDSNNSSASSSSTPIYNSNIIQCMTPRRHLLQTHALSQTSPALRDALALLRVWANQRGYGPGPARRGCITGFEKRGYFWTVVMHAMLLGEEDVGHKKKASIRRGVGRGLSSYQLFRAALDFFSRHDFVREPFVMKGGTQLVSSPTHEPVFLDSLGFNVLSGVPVSSLDSLRMDASHTLSRLNQSAVADDFDPFKETFLVDHRKLSSKYDVILNVDLNNAQAREAPLLDVLDYGSPFQHLTCALSKRLKDALGNRVKALTLFLPTSCPRDVSNGTVSVPTSSLRDVSIALTLDPEHAFRLVDHGPAVTEGDNISAEAADFRALWGKKAELRRFKDGRIVESVVWEVTTAEERARIPEHIVRHILALHFGVGKEDENEVRARQADFDALMRVPPPFVSRVVLPGAAPGYKNALTAFDSLVRLVRSLDTAPHQSMLPTLPLSILSVSPMATALRYTSTFTPIPLPLAHANAMSSSFRHLPSMDVVIQFERSGRWPDDLLAFQAMKVAFMEEVARCILARTEETGLRVQVVFPQGVPGPSSARLGKSEMEEMSRAYLEIVTPEGWAFSARIWHERELTLLERALGSKKAFFNAPNASSKPGSSTVSKASLQAALALYKRTYLHSPRHHRAVASLVHRYSAFGGTVRLVQRWFASHWLLTESSPRTEDSGESSVHVRCEVVELIVAYVFLVVCGGGEHVPGTKERGLFRVVGFLADWEWEKGVYVPLYEDNASHGDESVPSSTLGDASGSKEEVVSEKRPLVNLKAGSARSGAWTLATREDPEGRMWTDNGPTALIARRITAVAKATLQCVDEAEQGLGAILRPKALFAHPTDDYDVLIRLRPEVLCRTHQSILGAGSDGAAGSGRKYANIPGAGDDEDEELRVDYDPASEFFRDLKRIYSGTLEFFFDPFGGSVIGAVWDPSVLSARPFRVLADYSSTPICGPDDEQQLRPVATSTTRKEKKGGKEGLVGLNKSAVLAEIERLGAGLVQAIEVQKA